MQARLRSLFLLPLLLLAGCDSGSSAEVDGTMSASVAGTSFNADAVVAVRAGGMIQVNGTQAGSGGNVTSIAVMLMNLNAPGTVTLGGATNLSAVRYGSGNPQTNPQALVEYTSQSGTITVTELTDKKIKGTFSATVRNSSGTTRQITSGAFEGSFTSN
jgi:hypothetical protein